MFNTIVNIVFAFIIALALCVYTTMVQAQQAVVNGLVSYWTFDAADIAGNKVSDVFGDNNGTIIGAPKIVAGKVGEGLAFDGTKDYVDYGVFDLSDQGTVEAYIKPAAFGTILTILALGSQTCNTCYWHFRVYRNAKLEVAQCNNDQWDWLTGSTTFSENTWYHVAVVSNGTSYKLYVNGQEEGLTITGGANSGDWLGDTDKRDNITIGVFKRAALDDFFNGIIDEVRLYKRALSANEIKQNMNAEGLAVITSKKLTLTWGEIKISR
jgi:hypothetical protein